MKQGIVKPERIAGIVALSYLVLIPVGGAILWRRQSQISEDLDFIWDRDGIDPQKSSRQTPGQMLRGALNSVK